MTTDRDPPAALQERFLRACAGPSDINEHLGILWGLARSCLHVTEFGVRGGVSTTALLAAQPDSLHCYDLDACPIIAQLDRMRGRTTLTFTQADSRQVSIAPTDLLHIDTTHTYECLSAELRRHAAQVRCWIALHDTTIYPDLRRAIDELLIGGHWRVWAAWPHNNGMTILQRIAGA